MFMIGADLYDEDNILYISCSKVPISNSTSYGGPSDGQGLDWISLSYYGYGSFVLEVERKSVSCTYC
jgi:hypothetical protein